MSIPLLTKIRRWRLGICLLAGAAYFLVGSSWAVVSPVGTAPDDNFHLASIWCADLEKSYCERVLTTSEDGQSVTQWFGEVLVPDFIARPNCNEGGTSNSSSCQYGIPRDATPTTISRANVNLYPPIFYKVLSLFVSDNIERSVIEMRLFSVFLGALLFVLVLYICDRKIRVPYLFAMLTFSFPLFFSINASTNPSSWSFIGIPAYWALLHTACGARTTKEQLFAGIGSLLSGLIAAFSRADTSFFLIIVTIAVAVHSLNLQNHNLKSFKQWVLPFVVSMVVVGASLWARISSSQTNGSQAKVIPRVPWQGSNVDLFIYNFLDLPLYIAGMSGAPGPPEWRLGIARFDLPLPPMVWVLGIGLMGFLFLWGLRESYTKKTLSLCILAGSLFGLPLVVLQRQFGPAVYFLQPRYILPLAIVTLATSLLIRESSARFEMTHLQICLWGLSVLIMGTVSQHVAMRRYISGLDVVGIDLTISQEWWWNSPISPNQNWLFGVIASSALIILGLIASLTNFENSKQVGNEEIVKIPESRAINV